MVKKDVKSKKVSVDEALLENFVNLQHVLTNLAVKFEDLSGNISRLLQLFELSAKSFADKPITTPGVDQEFLKKLDRSFRSKQDNFKRYYDDGGSYKKSY